MSSTVVEVAVEFDGSEIWWWWFDEYGFSTLSDRNGSSPRRAYCGKNASSPINGVVELGEIGGEKEVVGDGGGVVLVKVLKNEWVKIFKNVP